jgi:hypothetical protein
VPVKKTHNLSSPSLPDSGHGPTEVVEVAALETQEPERMPPKLNDPLVRRSAPWGDRPSLSIGDPGIVELRENSADGETASLSQDDNPDW